MYRVNLLAAVAMCLFSAGRAASEEFVLTCSWERGATFKLKISGSSVIKNGRNATGQVSTSEDLISWHDTPLPGIDYEYNLDRHTGILVATAFSKLYNRKLTDKALCVKVGDGTTGPGF